MNVSLDDVKKLRESTGASMMACKKALQEAGDYEGAVDVLRKKGEAKAAEKAERTTGQGVVHSYVHNTGKVGAMIQLACETDFVAANETFIELANDIAMHIVAADPIALTPDDIDDAFIEKEKEIWKEQLLNEGKPEDKIAMILENKEKKVREESALLMQGFVKDPDKTIDDLIKEYINKLGENIQIIKFVRYQI